MKKLAIVINIFGDGAVPNIILDLYPYLLKKGWIIKIIAIQPLDKKQSCVQKAKDLGVDLESLDCKRTSLVRTYFRLRNVLNSYSPIIIHSHLGRADLYSPLAANRQAKVITTFHNVYSHYNYLTRLSYRFTESFVFRRVCVSRKVKSSWFRKHAKMSDGVVIYNPVSTDRLLNQRSISSIKNSLGLSSNDRYLLSAGRLITMKGHSTLIAAMPRLLERYPNLRLLISGIGPLEDALRGLSLELKVDHAVIFTGFRPDLNDLIFAAEVFVFPSLWEGLGLVAIEAMLVGTPVVATDIEPITEYLTQGQTGWLVPPKDPERLAEAISNVLSDPNEACRRAKAAKVRAKSMFDVERIASQYSELYESALL